MSLFFLLLLSFRLMYVGDWHLEKGGDDAASASGSVQRRKILRADDSWGTIRRDVTNQYWWVVHRFVMSITVQIYERVTWWLTGQRPSLSLSLSSSWWADPAYSRAVTAHALPNLEELLLLAQISIFGVKKHSNIITFPFRWRYYAAACRQNFHSGW